MGIEPRRARRPQRGLGLRPSAATKKFVPEKSVVTCYGSRCYECSNQESSTKNNVVQDCSTETEPKTLVERTWGLAWLASCRRGAIPSISVPSVISVVQDLLVPAEGRAGRICAICGSITPYRTGICIHSARFTGNWELSVNREKREPREKKRAESADDKVVADRDLQPTTDYWLPSTAFLPVFPSTFPRRESPIQPEGAVWGWFARMAGTDARPEGELMTALSTDSADYPSLACGRNQSIFQPRITPIPRI